MWVHDNYINQQMTYFNGFPVKDLTRSNETCKMRIFFVRDLDNQTCIIYFIGWRGMFVFMWIHTYLFIVSDFPVVRGLHLRPHILETRDLSSLSPGVFRNWTCSAAIYQSLTFINIMQDTTLLALIPKYSTQVWLFFIWTP